MAARLTRIYGEDGAAICGLTDARPGVLHDPVSGKPMRPWSKKWLAALYALNDLMPTLGNVGGDEGVA